MSAKHIPLALAIFLLFVVCQLTTSQSEISNSSSLDLQSGNASNVTLNPVLEAVNFDDKAFVVDEVAEFLNKTRSNMASGVCFFEVPTSSLSHNSKGAAVPPGNGSNPTLSRIQVCCEGYKPNEYNSLLCEPICKTNCPNGICTAPYKCLCLPGNVLDDRRNCVPACPIGCSNGFCQPDGSCLCKPGFVLDEATRKFCKPHCSNFCTDNAWCSAPETCKCNRNYKLSANATCLPSCGNCQNGNCTAPGVCVCNQGYERIGNVCKPICSKGCINAKCTAPETCSCNPGFKFDTSQAKCMPHCDKTCTNGFCSGGVCTCDPGYNYDRLTRNCKPSCSNGCVAHAKCVAPETCKCKNEYELSPHGTCLPKCECSNGFCDGSNHCTSCKHGYELDTNHRHVCKPHCSSGCRHGVCTSPNLCLCNAGYTKRRAHGKQTCVRV